MVEGPTRRTFLQTGVLAGTFGTYWTSSITSEARSQGEDDDWEMFQNDARNSAYAPNETPPTEEIALQWSVDVDGQAWSTVMAVDDTAYFVTRNPGALYAVSVTNGSIRWSREFETPESPAIVDGTVYTASSAGSVFALSTDDGSPEWTADLGAEAFSPPTVTGGTVYIGTTDGGVYALDASTGDQEWHSGVENAILAPPAVADGTVFVKEFDGYLRALSADDGSHQWEYHRPEDFPSAPVVADGTVYFGPNYNYLQALSTADGSVQWEYEFGDAVRAPASPAVTDDGVYVVFPAGFVFKLRRADGSLEWRTELDRPLASHSIVADDTVYVKGIPGGIFALSVDDGSERLLFDAGAENIIPPTIADGTVYGIGDGSSRATAYAISGETPIEVSDPHQFDPAVHGFGFDNWGGFKGFRSWYRESDASEETGSYNGHDHLAVSKDEVRNIVDETWLEPLDQAVENFDTAEPLIEAIVRKLYVEVNQGSSTNAHCYGMVGAARYYFEHNDQIPVDATVASDIQAPTDPQDNREEPVGDLIDQYQNSQALEFSFWKQMMTLKLNRGIDYEHERELIESDVEERGAAGVGLYDPDSGGAHQVLVYDVTETEAGFAFHFYDPIKPAPFYADREEPLLIPLYKGENGLEPGTFESSDHEYTRFRYIPIDSDVDPTALGLRGSGKLIWEAFLKDFVAFFTMSPVTIEVTAPDGTELDRLQSDHVDPEATEYEEIRYGYGLPSGDFDVHLEGEENGEYTLEALGSGADGGVIEESVTDSIEAGESHSFTATIPDTPDEIGQLQRTEGSSSDDDGASQEESGTGEDETTPDEDQQDDGGGDGLSIPTWVIPAGALTAIGAGGVAAYKFLGGGEPDGDDTDGELIADSADSEVAPVEEDEPEPAPPGAESEPRPVAADESSGQHANATAGAQEGPGQSPHDSLYVCPSCGAGVGADASECQDCGSQF